MQIPLQLKRGEDVSIMTEWRAHIRSIAVCLILAAAALLSLALPAKVLFTGEGFLADYIGDPKTLRFLGELLFLFILTGAGAAFIKSNRRFLMFLAAVALIFCWLHVVFLPMAVSALYIGFLLLLGGLPVRLFFETGDGESFALFWSRAGLAACFLMGSAAVIVIFCLMSLAGIGKLEWMRRICIALGIILYAAAFKKFLNRGGFSGETWRGGLPTFSLGTRLALCFIMVMFLLQIGRMNIALDFDTLWYGVRSEYIVAGGGGIYDNPGLVGVVYVYPKGLEILSLPLCDLASHSYLTFFTLWLTVLGIIETYRLGRIFAGRRGALLAALLSASIPAVMNMSICAKADIITWLLQLMMLELFFRYVAETEEGGRPVCLLILSAIAFLLSLTMKPTATVFSTAVFGMMGIYLICSRRLSVRASLRQWCALALPLAALFAVWARTWIITGMPITSVFTSLLEHLGFKLKYPFASGSIPQTWRDGEGVIALLSRRLWQMLLSPEGKDMDHVIIAWGSSLMFFLPVFAALVWIEGRRNKSVRSFGAVPAAARVIFWPFLIVNLTSLAMLYQVDGNYFILLYSLLIVLACTGAVRIAKNRAVLRTFLLLLVPLVAFNVLVTAQTNWAWTVGDSQIQLLNKGRVNHEAQAHESKILSGNAAIWQILASDPDNRVIAFGEHPECLEFPCNVQSYKDITSPWGNEELVDSPEAFEQYMAWAGTEYVYAEAGFLGPENWSWSYELLRSLIARGSVTELIYENGNALGKVGGERVTEAEAADNLRLFDEQYLQFSPDEGEP